MNSEKIFVILGRSFGKSWNLSLKCVRTLFDIIHTRCKLSIVVMFYDSKFYKHFLSFAKQTNSVVNAKREYPQIDIQLPVSELLSYALVSGCPSCPQVGVQLLLYLFIIWV